ncbi:MAG TPA: hypothetical protein VK802_16390 [Streptosporangiaceae bacterium]|nr:hypothetical protein [Streptosporangiaceae bacterium]
MAADKTAQRPTVSATKLRLRWLGIVVAVMALLTAGWPLLDKAVADQHPLAAGSRLTVGASPSSGVVTVGPGWSLLSAQSNPTQGYLLQRGNLNLSIMHVGLVDREQLPQMWRDLLRLLSVSNPGIRLSKPAFITTAHGLHAVTGGVTGSRQIGTATIVRAPSGNFGIEMVALAPRRTSPAMHAAAARVIFSLMFLAHGT